MAHDDDPSYDTLPVAGEAPTLHDGPERDRPVLRTSGPIASRYELGAVLGRGGMGEVIAARDRELGRTVAIKRMRASDPSPDSISRFLREAKVQARLDHPAIVPVHELRNDEQGRPYFVMKQLTGVPLDSVLERLASGDPDARAFSRPRLLRAFTDVCLAIELAHTRGIVHRDLKPSNIVLGDFGEVYVIDWGIAKVVGETAERRSFADIDTLEGSQTREGSVLGTPGYMAPEQIRADPDVGSRADIYALGCILFELLALEPLHKGGRAGIFSAAMGIDARASLRSPNRDIPPELDAICVTATMLEPSERFATARELGDVVQRFLDGDRDATLRKQLALTELEAAHAAIARGNTTVERSAAMRAAARALALDPQAQEPAQLVARLMLEPPGDVPEEVEQELQTTDRTTLMTQARLSSAAMFGYVAFFPVIYWAGFRSGWYTIAAPALVVVLIIGARIGARGPGPAWLVVMVVANALLIAMFSRIGTPFLVAPSLAILIGMVFAGHPKTGPIWLLWSVMFVAVIGPWAFEQVDILSSTLEVSGNRLVLVSGADVLDPVGTQFALVTYTAVILAIAIYLARTIANERRAIQRVVQTQSWQLRQLVSRAAA